MLPSTELYKRALHGPHQRVSYVQAFDIDGNQLSDRLRVAGGSVTANMNNRVSRTGSFDLPFEHWPTSPTDTFAPERTVVRIWSGIRYGDGTEEVFPLIQGRVGDPSLDAEGLVTFGVEDLASDVVAFQFETPENSLPGALVTAEIRRLILAAVPQAVFGTTDTVDHEVPDLVWDTDRGQALDDLANSLGARWFQLGTGEFVTRRFVYVTSPPVQEFLDGVSGLMSSATVARTRYGTANSVVVVSERLDGTDPIRVVERNTDPSSPLRFGGPYGRVSQVIQIQTPLTVGAAQELARAQVRAATALTEQWSAEVVPDHTLEPSDTVRFGYRGLMADQIIDSITYPLAAGATMRLTGRSSVPADFLGV